MKNICLVFFMLLLLFPLFGQEMEVFRQEGIASWYGREFEGRPTASGEIFDSSQLTAAHPTLPFGTMVVVTNRHNNRSVTVRINDRGPFVTARIMDVSRAAAEQLDMIVTGTAPVKVESVERIVSSNRAVSPQAPAQVHVVNVRPSPATVFSQTTVPEIAQPVIQFRLTPSINIVPERSYRLQVGSYSVVANAVDSFERLRNAGLSPAYERYTDNADNDFFRVVLAGIRGIDVQSTAEKISAAGFREALIREEN